MNAKSIFLYTRDLLLHAQIVDGMAFAWNANDPMR